MQISQLVRAKSEPLVGEMRLLDGHRSMCINPRVHYAGGIGPLWATEGALMEFRLEGSHRYYRGICTHVSPKTKTVTFAITEGNTWGKLVQGSTVGILANRFTRCHVVESAAVNLVREVALKEAKFLAKSLFAELSSSEVETDATQSLANWTTELLGEDNYQKLTLIINEYIDFQKELLITNEWYIKHPHKALNKKRSKLLKAINGINKNNKQRGK